MTDTIISGQKGKKGGPVQGNDTLRSETTGHVIDAISEGEIVGLVNGKASIFLNKTPLTNFEDCTFEQRVGRPDDSPVLGANEVEAYQSVGITVKQPGTQPLAHIRTINDVTVDMVRVYLTLQSLYFTSNKGATKVAHGGWNISVKPAGGAWVEKVNYPLHDKVTSPVQFQHDIMLPGVGPWDIRVEALLPDRSDDKAYETFAWDGYSAITKSKLSYPHTALVSMELSAEHVGSSIPERIYHVRGRKILVPTNYDPVAKTYSGVWDGTFKRAYSNCPAWVLYDAATNRIFGLGNEVPNDVHNKWRLYVIGQYCDQKIKSGYKDANGADIMEPRFSFDGVITDKKQAIETINQLTAVFRGMGFYSLSQFHIAADMPQDPAHIYGPANVIDGRFEYQTSSIKARHSVVLVRFNDKNNFFAPAIEPVIDNKALKEIGWREKTLDLIGCSSRSMARRYGAWVLDTENYETETVTFNVGMDSVHALPGEVIAINDPRRAEMRVSGRIKAISGTSTIILDQVIDPAISRSGLVVYISKPDGTIFTRSNVALGTNTINIGSGNATPDLVDCTYVIAATNLKPRQYRIVSIDEQSDGTTYQITALQYDRQKFARVEQGVEFKPEPYTVPKNVVAPPTNLTLTPKTYTEAGRVRTDIEIGWTAPQDTLVSHYEIMVSSPDQRPTLLPSTSMNSATFTSYVAGRHEVSVRTVNAAGRKSVALVGFVVIDGLAQSGVGEVQELVNAITGKPGPNFTGRDASIRWKSMMRVSDNPADPMIERDPAVYDHNTVDVYTGTTLLRSVHVKGSSFTYSYAMNEEDSLAKGFPSAQRALRFEVSVVNQEGKVSNPTVLNLSNPAPAAISPKTAVRGNNVSVEWANPKDEDLVGVKLWIERNNTFNPLNTAPKYDGLAGFYTFTGLPASTYYIRIAGYDAFSDDMMVISAPLLVSTGRDYFDDVAPDTPTGLVVTSSVAANGTATLVADWNDSAAADLLNYEVRIREGSGNYVSFITSQSHHEWTGLRLNTSYTVQVRAFDLSNNRSPYCAEVTRISAADTVAPNVPSGLTLKPGFNAIFALWNRNTEVDLAYYEVYQSTNTTAPVASTTPTYTVTSNTLNVSGLNEATAYNFWVRAVDTSGNKSAWCARVGAKTSAIPDPTITTENLVGLVDATSFGTGVQPITIWTGAALPTTRQTETISWQAKLYRWDATTNRYVADILANNAIQAAHLDAGAVTTEKLAVGFGGNLIQNSSFAAGMTGWGGIGHATSQHQTTVGIRPPGEWAGPDYPVLQIHQNGAANDGYFDVRYFGPSANSSPTSRGYPVTPGQWVGISVQPSTHRCALEVRLEFRNAQGTPVGYTEPVSIDNIPSSETNPNEWPLLWTKGLTPPGAVYVNPHFRKLATGSGYYDSRVFLHRPMMWLATAQQTEPPPYAPGNFTYIDGQQILTDSIKGRAVDVVDLTAKIATFDQAFIKDAHISGEISASKLKAGTVLSSTIMVEGRSLGSFASSNLFDDMSTMWNRHRADDNAILIPSFHAGHGYTGTHALVVSPNNGAESWLSSSKRMPFDPAKLYKVSFHIRREGVGGRSFYLGVMGLDENGTPVNNQGDPSISAQAYVAVIGAQINVPTSLTEYTGYIKGIGSTTSEGALPAPSISRAFKMNPKVKYIAPMAVFNEGPGDSCIMVMDRVSIEVVDEKAADVINYGSTKIEPGKITITGNTTLADWRMGGDETRINGGMISANTIRANHLAVGLRNVRLIGIQFEHNRPLANHVQWTAGRVEWVNDAGNTVSSYVGGGYAAWGGSVVYIYFDASAGGIGTTTDVRVMNYPSVIGLATYAGGAELIADYGRTIIDGSHIQTGTITATQLVKTAALITNEAQIGNATVNTLNIAGNAITVPVVAESETINVLPTTDYVDVGSVWITRAGAPTFVLANFQLDSTRTAGCAEFRLLRDSTQLGGRWATVTGSSGVQTSGSFSALDEDLGTGPAQYTLQARRLAAGGYTGGPRVVYRTLLALHVKR